MGIGWHCVGTSDHNNTAKLVFEKSIYKKSWCLHVTTQVVIGFRCQVSGVRCQVSGFRCQVSGFRFQERGKGKRVYYYWDGWGERLFEYPISSKECPMSKSGMCFLYLVIGNWMLAVGYSNDCWDVKPGEAQRRRAEFSWNLTPETWNLLPDAWLPE